MHEIRFPRLGKMSRVVLAFVIVVLLLAFASFVHFFEMDSARVSPPAQLSPPAISIG